MAALLMLQTVTDEGLGACFFGIPPTQIDDSEMHSAYQTNTAQSVR